MINKSQKNQIFVIVLEIILYLVIIVLSSVKGDTNMAYVISDECIACGTCLDDCPVDAISEGAIYTIDADLCTDCGNCAENCPVEAISEDD